jgi:hypothetical protein
LNNLIAGHRTNPRSGDLDAVRNDRGTDLRIALPGLHESAVSAVEPPDEAIDLPYFARDRIPRNTVSLAQGFSVVSCLEDFRVQDQSLAV